MIPERNLKITVYLLRVARNRKLYNSYAVHPNAKSAEKQRMLLSRDKNITFVKSVFHLQVVIFLALPTDLNATRAYCIMLAVLRWPLFQQVYHLT
jgi:hypothetical protein